MIVFDTDVISQVLKKNPPAAVLRKIAAIDPAEQATTSINAAELIFGAHQSDREEVLLERLKELVWPNLEILPFDFGAAGEYGRVRAELERKGRPLAEPDLRIASICLSRGASLVTGNVKHFSRIPTLVVEDWSELLVRPPSRR